MTQPQHHDAKTAPQPTAAQPAQTVVQPVVVQPVVQEHRSDCEVAMGYPDAVCSCPELKG